MSYYKAPDNSLHFIEPEFAHLLPQGSIQITNEEAIQIRQLAINNAEIRETLLTELRRVREQILNRLAGIALAAQIAGSQSTADAYIVARQSLLDITTNLSQDPMILQQEVMTRYQVIVGTLVNNAPELITAFAGVDI